MLRQRLECWAPAFAGVFLLLGGCAPQPAIAPNRIVSNNPCIDAVLAEVAAPQQIGAVSGWSHDPDSASAPLDWAKRYPALGASAEDVIAAQPRLALTGDLAGSGTNAALQRAGVRVKAFAVPASIAESLSQVRAIAASIDQVPAGEALAQRIERALSRPASNEPVAAIIWQSGGFVPGQGTWQDDLLARMGYANAAARYGLSGWDQLPVETLIRNPPRVIFMPLQAKGDGAHELAMRKALLARLGNRVTLVDFPERLGFCAGPTLIEAAARMQQAQVSL